MYQGPCKPGGGNVMAGNLNEVTVKRYGEALW